MNKMLTPAGSKFLFELYQFLLKAPLTPYGRYRTFENAAVDLQPLRLDSISLKALFHLVNEKSAKGLRRGHRMPRKERAAIMFDESTSWGESELLSFFYDNDAVTLITREENTKDGVLHWSPKIAVPPDILTTGSFSVKANHKDLRWASNALAEFLSTDDQAQPI